jgi:hypothetical protein
MRNFAAGLPVIMLCQHPASLITGTFKCTHSAPEASLRPILQDARQRLHFLLMKVRRLNSSEQVMACAADSQQRWHVLAAADLHDPAQTRHDEHHHTFNVSRISSLCILFWYAQAYAAWRQRRDRSNKGSQFDLQLDCDESRLSCSASWHMSTMTSSSP